MFSNKVVEIGVWWELCTHNYYYLPPRLNVNQNKAILQGVVYVCMSFTLVPFRLKKFCFGQNVWMCHVNREVVRGVSGVSWDTPIFQDLLYKFQQKNVSKRLRINVGYPNIKILTSSLLRCMFVCVQCYQ